MVSSCSLSEMFKDVELEDFVKYGLILEFIGCFFVVVILIELDEVVFI